MAVAPLQTVEREQAAWLGEVERSVIIPLKWLFIGFALVYWMWARGWVPPETTVFGLFILAMMLTAAEHYFFARDRVTPRQVRPFVAVSFIADTFFITALVVMDNRDPASLKATTVVSEYFVLYIALVLRGFALFRTSLENLAGFALASVSFLVAAHFQSVTSDLLAFPEVVKRLGLIWLMMLLTQGFISLMNRRKDEEIRRHERQVRSASLASLGELSAGVAHEINNPIGIIKTYAEFLEKSVAADNPMREDFETIRRESERCQEIVRRMLDFSNPQVQGLTSLNVHDLVLETAAFVFHAGESEGIVADVRQQGPVPQIQGDPVQLKQAFLNILVNARQILAEHRARESRDSDWQGRVTVVFGRGTGPRPPVRIEFQDNGPGLSAEDAERVFEPFFTRRPKGTGLGLAITRRIIEAHNGTIAIAPRTEGGAVVTVELPMEGEEAP